MVGEQSEIHFNGSKHLYGLAVFHARREFPLGHSLLRLLIQSITERANRGDGAGSSILIHNELEHDRSLYMRATSLGRVFRLDFVSNTGRRDTGTDAHRFLRTVGRLCA